ncbi:MAG: voltage-gated sodium channel, partial [Cryomorphaceae bacterium]
SVSLIGYLDIFVTVFFLIEIIVRIIAAGSIKTFLKSGWNIFDLVIVIASLVPLQGSETVLIGRLLRVFRVLRLVSMIPELKLLMNAFVLALPRIGYVALLMFIILYIYAAIGALFFDHINPVLWGNISISLLTLFRVATFEDWTDVMYETMEVYPLSWMFYLSFIFIVAFVFLNMMIGVVLDTLQQEHKRIDEEAGEGASAERQAIVEHSEKIEQRLERIEILLKKQNNQ